MKNQYLKTTMIKNRKNLKWIISGILILVAIGLLFIPINKNTEEYISLPPDVVVLSDGSFISLSHYYDMGYWKGINEMLIYLT